MVSSLNWTDGLLATNPANHSLTRSWLCPACPKMFHAKRPRMFVILDAVDGAGTHPTKPQKQIAFPGRTGWEQQRTMYMCCYGINIVSSCIDVAGVDHARHCCWLHHWRTDAGPNVVVRDPMKHDCQMWRPNDETRRWC